MTEFPLPQDPLSQHVRMLDANGGAQLVAEYLAAQFEKTDTDDDTVLMRFSACVRCGSYGVPPPSYMHALTAKLWSLVDAMPKASQTKCKEMAEKVSLVLAQQLIQGSVVTAKTVSTLLRVELQFSSSFEGPNGQEQESDIVVH